MKKSIVVVLGIALLALSVFSCATSIPVTLTKPSDINMVGIKRIAALPVGFSGEAGGDPLRAAFTRYNTWYNWRSPIEQEVSANLTNGIADALFRSGAFVIVNSSEVGKYVLAGQNPSAVVDGYILGEVTMMTADIKSSREQRTDPKTGKTTSELVVERIVNLNYNVSVYRAADGILMGMTRQQRTVRDTARGDNAYSMVKSERVLIGEAINETLPAVAKAIAPYTVTEYRVLAKDKTKNPDLVRAEELVKAKDYARAFELYTAVYRSTKNFAAGYNAAIVLEVMGDLKGAIASMEALFKASGDAQASKELARMRQTLADEERLAASK